MLSGTRRRWSKGESLKKGQRDAKVPFEEPYIPPVVPLDKHAGQIASPIASNPAKTLFQVLGTVFEGCLHLGSFVILHGDLPLVRVHPSRDEVIVVGVQLIGSPRLMREAKGESVVLKDFGAICYGPSGKAGQATIHMQTSRAIKVASLEV